MKRFLALEPVFTATTVQAVLALVLSAGVHVSPGVAGGVEAVAAAVLALISAAAVDKWQPAVITGLLTAVGTLLVAFGVPHVTGGEVSAVNAVVAIVMGSLLREKVTPVAAARPSPVRPAA
jgi:hypothetical protein